MKRHSVILIGFMGSGKSCIGRALAEASGFRFVDVDDVVVAMSDYESIAEIFEREGESFFRTLEAKAARRLATETGCVVACGGGLVTNGDALDCLKGDDGIVVYLQCAFEEIARRIT
ncbi:MAG: shikimate kinase, partial [Kiritimatiellaeota bacterium]|nr:shikimate kinase [Kiritimatiellota bacterium]